MADDVYDACVIGSGAGGGTAAWALASAGARTLLLERGPHHRTEEFVHDELTVCRRGYFVPEATRDPHVVARDGGPASRSADGWISTCVGGGTVHMGGYFFRMRAEDFELRTRFGDVAGANVADWPFDLATLAPFYDEIERVIGVSGDHVAEGRSAAYPLAPLATHPAGALVDEACRAVGMRPFQAARAIVSAGYDGRAPCHHCGFCASYGCEAGAKSSTLVTTIAKGLATGKLDLVADAMATRVELDPARRRATAVTYLDRDGRTRRVRARAIVLACSAIETARLMLLSELPDDSGMIGKNLMFAAFASGFARYALPSKHFPDGVGLPFIDRAVQDFYVAERGALAHPKAGTILFMLPHKNPIYQAERLADQGAGKPPVWGAALRAKLREFFLETRTVEWETFSESLPHPGCAVTLDPTVKDRFGLPVARIDLALHPASRAASDWLATKAEAALATTSPRSTGRGEERSYLVLQAGTARMGKDPKRSVTDPNGRAHALANLFVADSSGFPSSSGAPWTSTIMANALRVARGIAAAGKRGEL